MGARAIYASFEALVNTISRRVQMVGQTGARDNKELRDFIDEEIQGASKANQIDRLEKLAAEKGINPGGLIMIHGQKNGFGWFGFITQSFNWTDGCIAVKNFEMDEIWTSVYVGTPIIIEP